MPEWEINWIDYYAILEIDRNANQIEIKKAFHNLANYYHPDVNNSPDAEEKFKMINEAYTVLSDEAKKYEYDKAWDEHQEQLNNNSSNINYEDLEKDYNEAEINYAQKMALKKLIEEELNKVEQIINLKNELIFNAVSDEIEKRDFYATVRELINITLEYSESLKELAKRAYDNDLLEEEKLIEQTIEYCSNEINSMPKTPNEAKVYLYKAYSKSTLEEKVESSLNEAENNLKELNQFWQDVYNDKINCMDYTQYINIFTINFKEMISKLTELRKKAISLELNELADKITDMLSNLKINLERLPKNYNYAKELGHREIIKDILNQKLDEWLLNKAKLDDLITKVSTTNKGWRYTQEYIDLMAVINEIISEAKKIKKEVNDITVNKENKMNDIIKKSSDIYEQAEAIHKNTDETYHKMSEEIDIAGALELMDSVCTIENKNEAILLLNEAREIKKILYYLQNDNQDYAELYKKLDNIIQSYNFYDRVNYFRIGNFLQIFQEKDIMLKVDFIIICAKFFFLAICSWGPIEAVFNMNNPVYYKEHNSISFLSFVLVGLSVMLAKSIFKTLKEIPELVQDKNELNEAILKLKDNFFKR